MSWAGVRCRTPSALLTSGVRYRSTRTGNAHRLPVAANLLNREFEPSKPNTAWSADITYLPTREGWLYPAVVEDLFSRRIVGGAMAETMESRLVVNAVEMAVGPAARGRGGSPTRTAGASTPATTTSGCWRPPGSCAA